MKTKTFVLTLVSLICLNPLLEVLPVPQVIALTGGNSDPSSVTGGYSFIDSHESGGPSYHWIEIDGSGTIHGTPLVTPDDGSYNGYFDDSIMGSASNQMIPLGFNFPFFGQTKSNIWITSNGYLTFDTTLDPVNGYASYNPIPIPDITSESSDAIYPYWDDLSPEYLGGQIYYYSDTANNRFITEYKNNPDYCYDASSCQQMQTDGAIYTFEVILNQDGTILMQYKNGGDWSYYTHTIGVQNNDKTKGLQYPDPPSNGLAILFQATPPDPQKPTVSAGTDQTIPFDDTNLVNLLGTVTVENGDPYTSLWTFTSVPSNSTLTNTDIIDASSLTPHFNADVPGDYVLALTATNNVPNPPKITSDTLTITITDTVTPTNVNAGDDQTNVPLDGSPVSLSGSTDPVQYGGPLTYAWSFDSKPSNSSLAESTIVNRTTLTPHFTPDVFGDYILKFTVTNSAYPDYTASDTVKITVVNPAIPIVDAGPDQADIPVYPPTVVQLHGTASTTLPSQDLTYHWTFEYIPNRSSLTDASIQNANTLDPSFTPDADGSWYVLKLTVTNITASPNVSSSDTVNIATVNAPDINTPEVDAGNYPLPTGAKAYIPYPLHGSARVPSGRPITVNWSIATPLGLGWCDYGIGGVINQSSLTNAQLYAMCSYTSAAPSYPHNPYPVTLTATVTDENGVQYSASSTSNLYVDGSSYSPMTPVITMDPPPTDAKTFQSVSLSASATAWDYVTNTNSNDYLTYAWTVQSVPAGADTPTLLNDNTLHPSFLPTLPGDYTLQFTATDQHPNLPSNYWPSAYQQVTVHVAYAPNQDMPVVTTGNDLTGTIPNAVNVSASAVSPAGHPMTYQWEFSSLPSDSSLQNNNITSAETVNANFTPDVVGDYIMRFAATDTVSTLSASALLHIHVSQITFYNDASFITPITSIVSGDHLYIQIKDPQVDSGNTTLSISLQTTISADTEDITLTRVGDVFQGGGLPVSITLKETNDGTLEVENNDQITLHYQKTSGHITTYDFSQTSNANTNDDAQQISMETPNIGMSELYSMSLYAPNTHVFSSDGTNVFLSGYYSNPWEPVYIGTPVAGATNIQTYSIPSGANNLWNTYQYGDTLYSMPHQDSFETLNSTSGVEKHTLNINSSAFPSYTPPTHMYFYDMAIPSSTTGLTMSSLSGSGTIFSTQLSGSGTILTGTGTTLLSASGSLMTSSLNATSTLTGGDSVVALSTQFGGNGISILDSLNTQNLINWIHPNWTPPNDGIFANFIQMDKDNNLWFAGMDRHIDGSYVIDSQYFEKVPPILDGNGKVTNYDIANAVRYEIPHPVDPMDNSDPTVPFYASSGDPQAYIWQMPDAFTVDTNGNIWFDIPVGLSGWGTTHYYAFDTNTKTLRDVTTSMMALTDNNLSLGKVTISGTDYPLYQFNKWFVTKDSKIYLLLGKNGNMPNNSYIYDVPSQFCQINNPLDPASSWTMTCLPDLYPDNSFHLSREITSNYDSSYNSFLYDEGTSQRLFWNTRDLAGYIDLQDNTYHYLFTQKFPDGPTYSNATTIEKYNIAHDDTLYDVTDPPLPFGETITAWNTQIYYMDVQNIDPTNQITISWKGYNTVGNAEQVNENDIYLEAYNQNTGQWDVLDSRLAYTGEPSDFELSKTFTDSAEWIPYMNTTDNRITYRVREFDATWVAGTSLHTNYTSIQSTNLVTSVVTSNPLPLDTSSITYTLAITKAGTGTGNVTSSPTGINCGSTCSSDFDENTLVTLTASPDAGSSFTGWSGDCAGTNTTCTLTMDAAKNVNANFTLIILISGGGGGGGFPPTFLPGGEGGYAVDFNAAVSTFLDDHTTQLALLNSTDKQTLSFLVDMSGDINTENKNTTEVIDKRTDILADTIKNNTDTSQEKNYVTMNFDKSFSMVFTDSTILNNKTQSSNTFYIDVQKIKNTQYNPDISSGDLSLIRDPFVPVTEYNYAFTTYDQNNRMIRSFYRPVSLYAPIPTSVPKSMYHNLTFYKIEAGRMLAIPTVADEQRKLVKGITYSPDTYYLGIKTNMPQYKDVPNESSVMPYIYDMTSSDIVHGYDQTPGFYGPDNCVLRSEMIKMAIGSFDIPHSSTGTETLFQDTPSPSWYYPYLLAAVQNGILSADSSGNFNPDSCVSRADAVKIMVLAGHFPYQYYDDGSTVFSDVKATDTFRPYLAYAQKFGIIVGYPDGTFRPDANLKRSEVTSILWHAILTYSELGKRFTPMWEKTENALSDTTIFFPNNSNTNSTPIIGNGQ